MSDEALRRVRRACTNREVRKILVAAIKSGARHRLTRSGITFYSPDGISTAGTHFTASDRRAVRNLRSDLQRIGVLP